LTENEIVDCINKHRGLEQLVTAANPSIVTTTAATVLCHCKCANAVLIITDLQVGKRCIIVGVDRRNNVNMTDANKISIMSNT
jgi:hypothetical protein